jgi:hypothetical protein
MKLTCCLKLTPWSIALLEANIHLSNEQISQVDYFVYSHLHLLPVPTKINPVHALPQFFSKVHLKVAIISHFSHTCYVPHPSHSPWLYHSNHVCEDYKLWKSSLWTFLQHPVTASFLGPDILINWLTLFPDTSNICSVRDKFNGHTKQVIKLELYMFQSLIWVLAVVPHI